MGEPLERLLIGRTLVGRYEVEEVIGRGGMSVVYRATDHRLERRVALKIVSFPADLGEADRRELRERLRREAAAAARIAAHPNVVQVYDYGTDPDLDLDFIAMELLGGSDLRQALAAGRIGEPEAIRVLVEAARGIAAGHRAGIVHRDVKPGNIFLVGDGELEGVKILDFGIAKALEMESDEDLTQHGRIPHSPAYASPEQLDVSRPLSPASDVYQLGLVAYEVLAGERPWDDAARERIRAGETVPLPVRGRWNAVAPHVRGAVERALRPDPAERFGDTEEFARALVDPQDHDHTLYLSPSAPPIEPPAPREETVASPSRPPHLPAGRDLRRPAAAAAGIGALALLVWTLAPSRVDAPLPAEEPVSSDFEALDEEFRPLLFEAFRNLREAASADEGEEAAAAVRDVIGELQQAWVHGDLESHLDLYADRVDFRGVRNTPRERIERSRRESVERYSEREITIDRLAIEFLEPGRARAILDRRWRFAGDEIWEGAAREEMVLVKQEGRWRIVAETEIESFDTALSSG